MEILFDELLKQLGLKLTENSPGEWAQKLMMPKGRLLSPNNEVPKIPSAVLIALFEQNSQIFFQ